MGCKSYFRKRTFYVAGRRKILLFKLCYLYKRMADFHLLITNLCGDIRLPFPAYTIDIGRTDKGLLELIEIHPFISCGLYGFDNLPVIRRMAAQAWRYFASDQNG